MSLTLNLGFRMADVRETVTRGIGRATLRQQRKIPSATVSIVAGGSRGGATNALIARVQASMKRNPWFLRRDERLRIAKVLARAAARGGVTKQTLNRVGQMMLVAILKHVQAAENPDDSSFRSLSAEYEARKRVQVGSRPILIATGDLMNGLRVVVRTERAA